MKVIDLSHHQPKSFPFESAFSRGYEGFILRTGDGRKKDKNCDTYISQCISHKYPVGYYHFSRAKTKEEAYGEADFLISAVLRFYPVLGVYIDMEIYKSDKIHTDVYHWYLERFAERLPGIIVPIGIYTNEYNFNHYFDKTVFSGVDLWIAKYSKKAPSVDMPIKMWQYTSSPDASDFVVYAIDRSILFDNSVDEDDGTIGVRPSNNNSLESDMLDVLAGKYGVGDERRKNLKNAGIDPDKLQDELNRYYKIARNTVAGDYGNGKVRRMHFNGLGVNYDLVQAIVKIILNK